MLRINGILRQMMFLFISHEHNERRNMKKSSHGRSEKGDDDEREHTFWSRSVGDDFQIGCDHITAATHRNEATATTRVKELR